MAETITAWSLGPLITDQLPFKRELHYADQVLMGSLSQQTQTEALALRAQLPNS